MNDVEKLIRQHVGRDPVNITALASAIVHPGHCRPADLAIELMNMVDDGALVLTYHGIYPDGTMDPTGYGEPTDIPDDVDPKSRKYWDLTQCFRLAKAAEAAPEPQGGA